MSFRLRPPRLLSIIRLAAYSCLAAACIGQPAVLAHEGHDHDDAATTALAASTYPRVVAQSELYEIVGVLKKDRLTIYLDQLSSNEPVPGAKLTVTVGDSEPVDADFSVNGVYTFSLRRLNSAEAVEVVFSLIGRVIGDPNRTSIVQSVHGGRVTPLDGGVPRIGQAETKKAMFWCGTVTLTRNLQTR